MHLKRADAANAAASEFAERARRFDAIHGGRALEPFAANMHGRTALLELGDFALPALVSEPAPDSAWTCSPRTAYADCAREEAERNLPRWLRPPATGLARVAGAALGEGFDRVVALNHWLLSTDLYPALDAVPLDALLAQALQRWPTHMPWLRSLNAVDNADWLEALARLGFELVPSRQVYLYSNIAELARRHEDLRRDLALLRRTPLTRARDADIGEADYACVAELYGLLYLEKYSRLNPRYTVAFIRAWHRAGLLELHGFRGNDGRLACVVGLFVQAGFASSPIVGYDTAQPQKLGLYRLLSACAYEAGAQRGLRMNFSAGAASFKRLRGGEPAIEYSAFYTRHLPRAAARRVRALSLLTRRVGVPVLRRYQL